MSNPKIVNQQKIEEFIHLLENSLSGAPSPVSIMVETSEDEAILLGTTDAYIQVVVDILKSLTAHDENSNYRKVEVAECAVNMAPISSFHSLGHTVPRSLWITQNDSDSQTLRRYLEQLSPQN